MTAPQGRLGSVNVGSALLIAVLVLALGGLLLAVLYAQVRVAQDGPEHLGQHIPGARRRAVFCGVAFIIILVIEVGLFFVGQSAGGPAPAPAGTSSLRSGDHAEVGECLVRRALDHDALGGLLLQVLHCGSGEQLTWGHHRDPRGVGADHLC
jgi:hypothetical protein